jgi:hypothetical protein
VIDGVLLLCPLVDSFETVNKPENLPERSIICYAESLDLLEDDTDVIFFLDMAVNELIFIQLIKDWIWRIELEKKIKYLKKLKW